MAEMRRVAVLAFLAAFCGQLAVGATPLTAPARGESSWRVASDATAVTGPEESSSTSSPSEAPNRNASKLTLAKSAQNTGSPSRLVPARHPIQPVLASRLRVLDTVHRGRASFSPLAVTLQI